MMTSVKCFCHGCGFISLLICCCLVGVTSGADKLNCYQCDVERNDHCNDEFLRPCPDDQAYDRCMTKVTKSKSQGYLITKSCALGPCRLRDASQSSGLGLDDYCDRSKEEYNCIGCCKGNGCNTDDASSLKAFSYLVTLLVSCSVILFTQSIIQSG